jgi:hypothetical protein
VHGDLGSSLAEKVGRFINDAQVNHRRFFASSGTDLFAQKLEKPTGKTTATTEAVSSPSGRKRALASKCLLRRAKTEGGLEKRLAMKQEYRYDRHPSRSWL